MADALEEETESTISIQEYLKDVEQQELEADLVLGGDEGKECTYSNGYTKRQAIFSCLTCTPDGNAGVCTACSLSCHDGHEVLELWTKRNFRCDCGNSKFGEFFCKLSPNKDIENGENSYNHNFKGVYCTCGRPYPDPEVEEQEEMIQCCICEDWFHEEHLNLESADEIPRDEEGEPMYEDLVCQACSPTFSFLELYPQPIRVAAKQHVAIDTAKEKGVLDEANSSCPSSGKLEIEHGSSSLLEEGMVTLEASHEVRNVTDSSPISSSSAHCLLEVDLLSDLPAAKGSKALFLAKNWRDVLCRCRRCLSFYESKHISFLLDKDDSIAEYERMAKEKRDQKLQQQEGTELNFLNKLGHVEKIEILNGIADMKNEMHSFFESYDASRPITPEDIQQVFENLAKKRRREF